MRRFPYALLVAAAVLQISRPTPAAGGILDNGDFEAGNVGFTSDYPYLQQTGGYQVVRNPHDDWFGGFFDFGDHTTGSGLMLAVDGATYLPHPVVWQETVVASIPQTYLFSGWAASMGQGQPGIDPSSAILEFFVNDGLVGRFNVPETNGVWKSFTFRANILEPGPVTLKIIDTNTAGFGNDFVLDDLAYDVVPEPSSISMSAIPLMTGLWYAWRRRG